MLGADPTAPEAASPSAPADFRLRLQEELIQRCRRNPRYSVRAYARSLGMDFSTLAKLLRGERPLGKLLIRRLGARIGLTPHEVERYVGARAARDLHPSPARGAGAVAPANYRQLSLDAFSIIADWYHYAILELMRVKGFSPEPRFVARALGITPAEARAAVERLIRVGLIEIRPDGSWQDLSDGYSTTIGNDFTAAAFRKLQRGILEKAVTALEEVPIERRDQSSMTMAIDTRKLAEAKRVIQQFRRDLNRLLSAGDAAPDEVYHLSVSLYPVTRLNESAPPRPPKAGSPASERTEEN